MGPLGKAEYTKGTTVENANKGKDGPSVDVSWPVSLDSQVLATFPGTMATVARIDAARGLNNVDFFSLRLIWLWPLMITQSFNIRVQC